MGMRYSSPFDVANLKKNLFRKKRQINKKAADAVEAGAELIMNQSIANAPVDTHNLEKAHHLERTDTRAGNVRVTIQVSGVGFGSEDVRSVEDYAGIMHEWSGGWGPKTLAKQATSSANVGSKYLERALDEHYPTLLVMVRAAMKDGLND